jgi:hypothetical protein
MEARFFQPIHGNDDPPSYFSVNQKHDEELHRFKEELQKAADQKAANVRKHHEKTRMQKAKEEEVQHCFRSVFCPHWVCVLVCLLACLFACFLASRFARLSFSFVCLLLLTMCWLDRMCPKLRRV